MEAKTPVIGAVGLGGESVFLSVDHFHAPGETLQAENLYTEPGGKAYNQAVAARRLGAEVLFFGAMGQDCYGDACEAFLRREGITPVLERISGGTTAYACILTDRRGENQVTVSRGASQQLSAAFLQDHEADIRRCNHMLLGLECPLDATREALALCRRHGVYTILNPAPAYPLDLAFLRTFDLLTPNLQEATVLLALPEPPTPRVLAQRLEQAGLTRVVVTLGGDGCLLYDHGTALHYPARKVQAVDTTGAGDTFNAALAVALGQGHTLPEAVVYATNASAYSVMRPHVMDSLPTKEQLERFFQPLSPIQL